MGLAMHCKTRIVHGVLFISLAAPLSTTASGQTPAFVAPPRTIADITAILDQEKPDPKLAAKLRTDADAKPQANANRGDLARFYYDRCVARSTLGDNQAVTDCEKAVQLGQGWLSINDYGRLRQGLSNEYAALGVP